MTAATAAAQVLVDALPRMRRAALSVVTCTADADDAVQQAALTFLEHADRFYLDDKPTALLALMTTRAAIDEHRKRARLHLTDVTPDQVDDDLDPFEQLLTQLQRDDLALTVRWVLSGWLSADRVEAVIAYHDAGRGEHAVVAGRLGLSLNGLQQLVHRAHVRLAPVLTEERAG